MNCDDIDVGDSVAFASRHGKERHFGTVTAIGDIVEFGRPLMTRVLMRSGITVSKPVTELEKVTPLADSEIIRQAATILRRDIKAQLWRIGISVNVPGQLDDYARRLEYEAYLREASDD